MKIVVIGGAAAGLTAASQVKRRMPDAEVTVLEKGGDVSYGACGMPYNLLQKDISAESLYALSHKQITKDRGITYRLFSEVMHIDAANSRVRILDTRAFRDYDEEYDYLIYAAGASPRRLNIPGFDGENVFYFKTLEDLRNLKTFIHDNAPRKACLVGGGNINLELAEVLTEKGIQVTVIEKMEEILPSFAVQIREKAVECLREKGVVLHTGTDIESWEGGILKTSKGKIACDFVVAAVGVQPNTQLFAGAGGKLGFKKAVKVDRYLRTNFSNILAAGDCAEHYIRPLGRNQYMPLGTTANKQGRTAGYNAAHPGEMKPFPGVDQTAVFKLFDLTVGTTGLSEKQIEYESYSWGKVVVESRTRGSYPGGGRIRICLLFEKGSGRLLGAQMVGEDVVAKRLDVLAAAVYSRLTVFELAELDLSYAPPFAPVWDPILVAANQAVKEV